MAETKAVVARVSGRVQGVWYRASTVDQARKLGVTGWVRNAGDGSVEFYAEGPARAVDDLVTWCRQGPPLARVTSVDVSEVPTRGYASFEVTW